MINKIPIGFMSYVRSDDAHENGVFTDFCTRLCGEVRMQSGDGSFTIFLDRNDIAWGQQWAQRLDESLGAVTLLIPMITPSFFKSEACGSWSSFARFAPRRVDFLKRQPGGTAMPSHNSARSMLAKKRASAIGPLCSQLHINNGSRLRLAHATLY